MKFFLVTLTFIIVITFFTLFHNFIFAIIFLFFDTIESEFKGFLGSDHKIYKYDKTPCEDKNFTISESMILLENKDSAMIESFYSITRYSLDNYKKYLIHEDTKYQSDMHKEIKLYGKSSTFKVLSYYWHIHAVTFGHSMPAYLIETNDGYQAWIPSFEFDSNLCEPTTRYVNATDYHFHTIDANYTKTEIEIKKPTKPFASSDETYAITKKLYDNKYKK